MISRLKEYVSKNEDWLMERILGYAKQRGYTDYTSTLKEAWRLSISGLSNSLMDALDKKGDNLELGPHEDYVADPACQFGIIEAKRHRQRGISLAMFLGLMKYYRQSYSDLIREADFDPKSKYQYEQILKRFFDRVEIGFCTTWASAEDDDIVKEMQHSNRNMTNEKNKYLTIFESMSMPIFIVALDGTIENMNYAASGMLKYKNAPGTQYYGDNDRMIFIDVFPWLKKYYLKFVSGSESKITFETALSNSDQHFSISFSRSLDISGKFSNTIVIIEDITHAKYHENTLLEKEKLVGVVQTAGAVCHEINQPLMILKGLAELMEMDFKKGHVTEKQLLNLKRQIGRLGTITTKMMKITHVKTKPYLDGEIIDIDASTDS